MLSRLNFTFNRRTSTHIHLFKVFALIRIWKSSNYTFTFFLDFWLTCLYHWLTKSIVVLFQYGSCVIMLQDLVCFRYGFDCHLLEIMSSLSCSLLLKYRVDSFFFILLIFFVYFRRKYARAERHELALIWSAVTSTGSCIYFRCELDFFLLLSDFDGDLYWVNNMRKVVSFGVGSISKVGRKLIRHVSCMHSIVIEGCFSRHLWWEWFVWQELSICIAYLFGFLREFQVFKHLHFLCNVCDFDL